MWQNMWACQTVTSNPCPHINAELLLVSMQYSFNHNSQIKCSQMHDDMDILSGFGMWNLFPKFIHTFQLHPGCVHVTHIIYGGRGYSFLNFTMKNDGTGIMM
jgi:hypothetical protein